MGTFTICSQDIKTNYEDIYFQNSDSCIGYYAVQPYPNPFGGVTQIKFGVPDSSNISILIKVHSGKKIYSLENIILKSGNYYFNYGNILKNEQASVYFMKLDSKIEKLSRVMEFNAVLKLFILK